MNDTTRKAFEQLEADPSSSFSEAKESYRHLIHVWHPDKHSHNEKLQERATRKVKGLNAAWETVKAYFEEQDSVVVQ